MAYDSPTVSSSTRHFLADPEAIDNTIHGKNQHHLLRNSGKNHHPLNHNHSANSNHSAKSNHSVKSNDGYDGSSGGSPSYVFRGFVGYYGLHYISVFQDRCGGMGEADTPGGGGEGPKSSGGGGGAGGGAGGEGQFLLFDDMNVRSLGSWEDVKRQCVRLVRVRTTKLGQLS